MIREFANLFELTVRELRLAGERIRCQSPLACRIALRTNRIRRIWRRAKRRRRSISPSSALGYHDWRSVRLPNRSCFECQYCGLKSLHPTSVSAQRRFGIRCPKAPRIEVVNAKN
jgi:hypothetical protein